jgi:DNA modification methylase
MYTILEGDVMEMLRTLPDESVQCCITSPPYWGLRDYGIAASVWPGRQGTGNREQERPEEHA